MGGDAGVLERLFLSGEGDRSSTERRSAFDERRSMSEKRRFMNNKSRSSNHK
jgi:hypothetical protein